MVSTRKVKSQRKQDLRQKNLGVVGKIDIDETPQSNTKKILFGDDFVASDYESAAETEEEAEAMAKARAESKAKEKARAMSKLEEVTEAPSEVEENADSDSDDEVEEVGASAAKKQALDVMAAERETRKQEAAISSKRKRKTRLKEDKKNTNIQSEEEDDDEDDDLDEDFFASVDEERRQEANAKKVRKDFDKKKYGKHTTFVSEMDDPNLPGSITAPIDIDHSIEVVILPGLGSEEIEVGDNANNNVDGGTSSSGSRKQKIVRDRNDLMLSAGHGTEPSSMALLFCRGIQAIRNETERATEKGFEKKRSRRAKFKQSIGRPSSHFATRKKRN